MKKTSLGKEKAFKNAAVLFAVTVLFTGCGSMSTDSGSVKTAASNSSVGSYYESAAYGEESAVFEAANEDWDYESGEDAKTVTDAAAQTERKLIKTVDMTVETKEFDKTLKLLQDKINACGGLCGKYEYLQRKCIFGLPKQQGCFHDGAYSEKGTGRILRYCIRHLQCDQKE